MGISGFIALLKIFNGFFPLFSCFPVPSLHSEGLFNLFHLKDSKPHPPSPCSDGPLLKLCNLRARSLRVLPDALPCAGFCWISILHGHLDCCLSHPLSLLLGSQLSCDPEGHLQLFSSIQMLLPFPGDFCCLVRASHEFSSCLCAVCHIFLLSSDHCHDIHSSYG